MMKAFDYLDSVRVIEIRIQIKTRQAEHLRDTMSNITAPLDKEQVSHTKNVSAMQDTMAMVLDLEEEISFCPGQDASSSPVHRHEVLAYRHDLRHIVDEHLDCAYMAGLLAFGSLYRFAAVYCGVLQPDGYIRLLRIYEKPGKERDTIFLQMLRVGQKVSHRQDRILEVYDESG